MLKLRELFLGKRTKNFRDIDDKGVRDSVLRILCYEGSGVQYVVLPRCNFSAHIEPFSSTQVSQDKYFVKTLDVADGVIVREPGVSVLMLPADCPIVTLFDEEQSLLAVLHVGYRSLFGDGKIRSPSILDTVFGRDQFSIERTRVKVGPSIRSCCFGVEHHPEIIGLEYGVATKGPRRGQRSFDLTSYIGKEMMQRGIPEQHIEITGYCTACRGRSEGDSSTDLKDSHFHSNCWDGPNAGRNLFAVWMSEE